MDDRESIQRVIQALLKEERQATEAARNIERRSAYELKRAAHLYARLRGQPAPETIMLCGDRRGGGLYAVR